MYSPMTFHTFVFGAAQHQALLRYQGGLADGNRAIRLYHHGEAIKLVNRDVSNLTGSPSDELIGCILTLQMFRFVWFKSIGRTPQGTWEVCMVASLPGLLQPCSRLMSDKNEGMAVRRQIGGRFSAGDGGKLEEDRVAVA